jgi:hypothetical protein
MCEADIVAALSAFLLERVHDWGLRSSTFLCFVSRAISIESILLLKYFFVGSIRKQAICTLKRRGLGQVQWLMLINPSYTEGVGGWMITVQSGLGTKKKKG